MLSFDVNFAEVKQRHRMDTFTVLGMVAGLAVGKALIKRLVFVQTVDTVGFWKAVNPKSRESIGDVLPSDWQLSFCR